MNYIKQLNEFYPTLDYKPLNAEAIAIYFCLLQIANKTGWIDQFRVANTVLMSKCNIDKQKLTRAREKLITQGYITYSKGKNQSEAPIYSIVQLYTDTPNDIANDTQNNMAGNTADDTINKQKEIKQLKEHFEKIWEIYPNKKDKLKAEEFFFKWVKGRKINKSTIKLTDLQMYNAVKKYRKECEDKRIEEQYIKHGGTFFNKAILDYVEKENE